MPTQYRGPQAERRALNAFVKMNRALNSLELRQQGPVARAGLTGSQFGVLEALLHRGSMCQARLGEKILRSPGNLTVVVDNLERRGLVRRERSTEDRREVLVHLTDDGRRLVERVFPEVAAAITDHMSVLTPGEQVELARLSRILGRQERR
jgi:MarR family transcriptional regulator, 2-MHQ and catechol-resistance regulon repressor